MAGKKKKIKLEEEAISEIQVADTASELGAEASDVNRLVSGIRRRRRRGTTITTASRHNKHWPANPTALPCSSHSQRKGTQHTRCDMGMCVVPCFTEYHTKVNL
jgi:hypothetical protein